ncbi:efflux RND transporter periplasmic adaptor subunit [Thiorhodococcus fuscus]|uniref:Efflux RND transporter periplasmic adaptor subunit n=1 Tax=Thiorhodococcus fuscus TaxID=527200 RepID=A0ABW4Y6G1_9GAMM
MLLCGALFTAPAGLAAPVAGVVVMVAEVQRQTLAEPVEALGTLQANESVAITSNVTETISALHFDDGQRVRAGDLLVEMTNAEEHALLEEARVRAAEAERQFRRVKSLVAQGSASESLLDERRRDLDAARAMLVALESRLADRVIKAPFNGVLGLRNVSQGALVEPGDLITTLDDDSRMKLDFSIASVFLGALAPGMTISAKTAAFPGQVFTGQVTGIDTRIDPVTRSVKVRALIPNAEGHLKPGLLMQVELRINPRETLVIPEAAVQHRGEEHFVMRVSQGEAGPVAERRAIATGTRQAGVVEVLSGLDLGDRVVTDGNEKIHSGQSLRILAKAGQARPEALKMEASP